MSCGRSAGSVEPNRRAAVTVRPPTTKTSVKGSYDPSTPGSTTGTDRAVVGVVDRAHRAVETSHAR